MWQQKRNWRNTRTDLKVKLEELKKDLEKGDFLYKGPCHDCGIPVIVDAHVTEDGAIHISGGVVYKIRVGVGARYFFKCTSCYQEDNILRDYQECEVYSRVVGYLRPVKQWNNGKVAEWNARKEFIISKGN